MMGSFMDYHRRRRPSRVLILILVALLGAWTHADANNTCAGNLLATSIETGCALGRCTCWPYISQCDAGLSCDMGFIDSDGEHVDATCHGECVPTPLGKLLNLIRWLFLLGCPSLVLLVHVYQRYCRRRTPDVKTRDVDQEQSGVGGGDGLLEKAQARKLLARLHKAMVQNTIAVGDMVARVAHIQQTHRQPSSGDAIEYDGFESPHVNDAFAPDDAKSTNHLDAGIDCVRVFRYIDLGRLERNQTHGAYVIKVTPQIYLETMHKNVLPLLFTSMTFIFILTAIFTLHPTPLTSSSVRLTDRGCVDGVFRQEHRCGAFESTSTTDAGVHRRVVHFASTNIPDTPDVLDFRFDVDDTLALGHRPGAFDLGTYEMTVSAAGAATPLVQDYTNKLITTCTCRVNTTACAPLVCQDVSLVGLLLKRYGSSLYDVRAREFTIELTVHLSLMASSSSLPSYSIVMTSFDNEWEWAAQLTRGLLGGVSTLVLVHFLYMMRLPSSGDATHVIDPNAASSPRLSLYHRLWAHLSLERKLLAFILSLLAIHFNPLMLFLTRAATGTPAHRYFVFRSVWECLTYACSLGALLVLVDSYRKESRQFTNGASSRIVGVRFLLVKCVVVAAVVALQLSLSLGLEGTQPHDVSANMAQWIQIVDTLLLVGAISVFLGVAARVHRVLGAQRYSETRYLALSFRYLVAITYTALAVLLLNSITATSFAEVSTTKSAVLPTTSVVSEVAFSLLMFFAVVAFYPPSPHETGRMPRGYVIRERRQFITTPRDEDETEADARSSTCRPIPEDDDDDDDDDDQVTRQSSARSFAIGGNRHASLRRVSGFRAKPVSEPHHLFCLETACVLFNCSRHAYYRSSVNIAKDTNEHGVVTYPASKYVNQAALARDRLREVAHIIDEATDTHCVVFMKGPTLVFAFRGTASHQNVKTDLEFALEEVKWLPQDGTHPLLVHRGFLVAYETVRSQCHEILHALRHGPLAVSAETHIYCTGHSLGGALATLAAIDFKHTYQQRVVMYNYGSPRVGTHSFYHFFNAHVPLAFRLVNEGDIVCGLPQRFSKSCCGHGKRLYKHIGTEVVMDGKVNGDFIVRPTFAEKNLIVQVRSKPGRHYLQGYKENLDVILDGALQSEQSLGDFRMQNPLERALYGMDTIEDEDDDGLPPPMLDDKVGGIV
ncbi:Aste57867_12390 [Aphanomyces stellatus]|uniref:Aste57867_12390 protein n=1 Tax=Aphanomyces stellatus TaxID=120398 RepID=A0A485KVF5_9STRA|nr:hypothetical protein As57867_012344 [Aphanomyces stellatus]VFT89241.1 Aste57867_12390 [Aphanomyces stellatus]